MPTHERSTRAPLVVFLVAVAVLAVGIARDAWPWIADDAFISLRFAERLVAGGGLTWTDGERVEGYSNLLWVLLTALLGSLGCDWIAAVRMLGIACAVATLALLASTAVGRRQPAGLAVMALAAQASVAVWTIGGLEVPLAMLLVAVAMVGLARGLEPHPTATRWLAIAGAALGLLALTRPDGPLWAAVAAATVVVFGRAGSPAPPGRSRWRGLAVLLLPPLLAVLLQLAFRLVYYGDWLPNTGRAKVSPSAASLAVGLDYLLSAATALRGLLLPAAVGLLLGWRRQSARPQLTFAGLGLLAWALYLLQVGGDVFPRNRLVVPALAPLALLAAHGLSALAELGRPGLAAAWLLGLGSVLLGRLDAEQPSADPRQQLSTWEWQGAATGTWLGRAFHAQQPLLAVDAAGAVPFFSRLPCLDMLGLCDKTIAATPTPPERGFIPGHNRGNGPYVLSRQPDLVIFWLPPGNPQPRWLSGAQMEEDPAFLAGYRVVLFDTGVMEFGDGGRGALRITSWVRLEGRLGVSRRPDRIVVPGYWLGSYRQPRPFRFYSKPLQPDEEGYAEVLHAAAVGAQWWKDAAVTGVFDARRGAVVGQVHRHGHHVLPELALPDGRWTLHAGDLPPGVELGLRGPAGREPTHEGAVWSVASVAGGSTSVDLVCIVPESVPVPFSLTEVVLQRSD